MAETNKKPNFFVRTGKRFSKWFREMKKQLLNNTIIVLVAVLIVGVIVCLFDFVAGLGIDLLGKLF